VLRRTHASLSRKAKVDDKVSADQRGHGLGVSLAVYAVSDLEQKIDAVTKLESDVFADSGLIELMGDCGTNERSGRKQDLHICQWNRSKRSKPVFSQFL
jgi:hypothetical protein